MRDFDNPDSSNPSRRVWLISAIVSAVIVLGYASAWFLLAVGAREQVDLWMEERRGEGFTVRYDSLEATGFPFKIRIDIAGPGFGAPLLETPWGWEGERLSLEMTPWNSDTVRAHLTGAQMLAVPVGGRTQTYTGTLQSLKATVNLRNGQPNRVELALQSLELAAEKSSLGTIRIGKTDLEVEEFHLSEPNHQTPSGTLSGAFENIQLPWLAGSPLGRTVENLAIKARLMGLLARGPLVQSLEDWRDGGGTIEIKQLDIGHGPLNIKTDGTIALDGTLQPIGALTARIQGFFEAVDALQKLGVVQPRDAITAKMVLGVLARKPQGGGRASLNLALTVQERRLYAGPVPLITIPRVIWREFAR